MFLLDFYWPHSPTLRVNRHNVPLKLSISGKELLAWLKGLKTKHWKTNNPLCLSEKDKMLKITLVPYTVL